MIKAEHLARLVSKLHAAAADNIEVGAVLTLRFGNYGVAFVRERNGEPETLLEIDLLELAEKLEGEG